LGVERKGLIEFRGQDVTVVGEDVQEGDQAPEFSVLTMDWTWMNALEDTQGKVRIIGSLPSLNTAVCDRETKRFEHGSALDSQPVVCCGWRRTSDHFIRSQEFRVWKKIWCIYKGIAHI
jgi:peroxiredoxin